MTERWDLVYRYSVACGGSAICYLFGGWSYLLGALLTLVVADYATGLVAAWVKKELNSDIGRRGIAKKVCIFLLVALGHIVDVTLGTAIFQNAVAFFYLSNEFVSILENVGTIGLPIPPALKNAIKILNGKSEVGINEEEEVN